MPGDAVTTAKVELSGTPVAGEVWTLTINGDPATTFAVTVAGDIDTLDEIAGEDDPLKQYIELWDSILDAGISFSTIGVQDGWDERSEYFGNSYH